MRKQQTFPVALVAFALILGLTACDSAFDMGDVSLSPDTHAAHANVNQQLAAARAATAAFQRVDVAEAAGYAGEGEPCVYHGELGGMGIHFVNGGLMGPPEALDVRKPQALLYEPTENGRLRLVGVEYIVPYGIHPIDEEPPMLFGQHFHPGPPYVGWALHVWIWRDNPSGTFFDFNPRVSCEFADVAIDVTAPPPGP